MVKMFHIFTINQQIIEIYRNQQISFVTKVSGDIMTFLQMSR